MSYVVFITIGLSSSFDLNLSVSHLNVTFKSWLWCMERCFNEQVTCCTSLRTGVCIAEIISDARWIAATVAPATEGGDRARVFILVSLGFNWERICFKEESGEQLREPQHQLQASVYIWTHMYNLRHNFDLSLFYILILFAMFSLAIISKRTCEYSTQIF